LDEFVMDEFLDEFHSFSEGSIGPDSGSISVPMRSSSETCPLIEGGGLLLEDLFLDL